MGGGRSKRAVVDHRKPPLDEAYTRKLAGSIRMTYLRPSPRATRINQVTL